MQALIQRFWGFDKLIGPVLVKVIYYLGLAGIGAAAGIALITGLVTLPGDFLHGLILVIMGPLIGAVALIYWRFFCEIFILAFEIYERLGEIRDRLPKTMF